MAPRIIDMSQKFLSLNCNVSAFLLARDALATPKHLQPVTQRCAFACWPTRSIRCSFTSPRTFSLVHSFLVLSRQAGHRAHLPDLGISLMAGPGMNGDKCDVLHRYHGLETYTHYSDDTTVTEHSWALWQSLTHSRFHRSVDRCTIPVPVPVYKYTRFYARLPSALPVDENFVQNGCCWHSLLSNHTCPNLTKPSGQDELPSASN